MRITSEFFWSDDLLLSPLWTHLHPPPSVKIQEPFIPNMLPGDELWQHLPVAAGMVWPSGTVTFFKGAEVGAHHVHLGVELGDAVLVPGVAAVVENGHFVLQLTSRIAQDILRPN